MLIRKLSSDYFNKMKKLIIYLSLLLPIRAFAQTPPYSGTIFIDPDIITSSDVSTIQSTTYTGQGSRTVFDRRVNDWVTINAFLFDVVWNDGLSSEAIVNPEFDNVDSATVEAEKYAFLIGQLPNILRKDIHEIWIHKGIEPFGGGNNSILIHTGQSSIYENDGIIEETLVHEASHTSLDIPHATSTGWINAQNADGNYISTYAQDNPTSEDLAESFLTWLATRYRSSRISSANYETITQTIPNRLAYFDDQNFNMYPITEGVSVHDNIDSNNELFIFPNPVQSTINFSKEVSNVKITDISGRVVKELSLTGTSIDISNLENGIYIITGITKAGKTITRKIVVE